jgi:hypothetical protein
MKRGRAFLIGRCCGKSRTLWLVQCVDSPIVGPFRLCAVVSPR